jgi:hypothetical protein
MVDDSYRRKSSTGFERKVLRKIYGPTPDKDGTWRVKTNEETENLIRKKKLEDL